MKNNTYTKLRQSAFGLAPVYLMAMLATPAQGALVISINPTNTTVAAGASGFFDVILTNTTAATPRIAGFSFALTASSVNLVFTNLTTAVPNFIFAGNSFVNDFLGGDLRPSPGGPPTFPGSDITSNGANVTLAGNSSVGLGRVFFTVSAGAPAGSISVTVDNTAATFLFDALGAVVPRGASPSGTVTVTATPEPGSAALFTAAIAGLWLVRKRRG